MTADTSGRNVMTSYTLIMCAAFTIGALAITVLVYRHVYLKARVEFSRERALQQDAHYSLWRYGIVESVDLVRQQLTVQIENPFASVPEKLPFLVQVSEETQIAKQELISSGEVYTALSSTTPAALVDIQSGVRVALLLENRPEYASMVARVILFGNPL